MSSNGRGSRNSRGPNEAQLAYRKFLEQSGEKAEVDEAEFRERYPRRNKSLRFDSALATSAQAESLIPPPKIDAIVREMGLKLRTMCPSDLDVNRRVLQLFKKFDHSGTGRMSAPEFRRTLRNFFQIRMNKETAEALVQRLNPGRNFVTHPQFVIGFTRHIDREDVLRPARQESLDTGLEFKTDHKGTRKASTGLNVSCQLSGNTHWALVNHKTFIGNELTQQLPVVQDHKAVLENIKERIVQRAASDKDVVRKANQVWRQYESETAGKAGGMSPDDLKALLLLVFEINIPLTVVHDLFEEIDADHSGRISRKEFVTKFCGHQRRRPKHREPPVIGVLSECTGTRYCTGRVNNLRNHCLKHQQQTSVHRLSVNSTPMVETGKDSYDKANDAWGGLGYYMSHQKHRIPGSRARAWC
jgi:Ca2+-binding EF-hand superfamily protein